jgi:hypothetical protein
MALETTLRTLELTEFERVVPRGVQKQTWSVKLDGRWVAAVKVPGAVIVKSPSQRGVVWQRHVQLQLRPGTHLRLVTESPRVAKPRDVFSVITVDAHSQTRARTEEFCVTPGGTLAQPLAK